MSIDIRAVENRIRLAHTKAKLCGNDRKARELAPQIRFLWGLILKRTVAQDCQPSECVLDRCESANEIQ